jgi:tetratricopeptide (TPR) repeat protein
VSSGGGGAATFGGTDTQSSVAAFVAVYLLGRKPLNWLTLDVQDVPTALLGETLGPGDDIRVEFLDTTHRLEIQSKHGLQAGAKLNDALDAIVIALPSVDDMTVFIAVDPTASKKIKTDLHDDLIRLAEGRTDGLSAITEDARGRFAAAGGDRLLARVRVVVLDLDHMSSAHTQVCLMILREILENPAQAESALDVIGKECVRICRMRSRADHQSLAALLSRRGIKLRDQSRPVANASLSGFRGEGLTAAGDAAEEAKSPPPQAESPGAAAIRRTESILQTAKDLLDAAKNHAALAVLETVYASPETKDLPKQVLATLYGRIGVALLRLGRLDEARQMLERSLAQNEDHYASLLNLGVLEASRRDDARAVALLDRAIAIEPKSALAWASRASVAQRLGLSNVPPVDVLDLPDYLASVAFAALSHGDWATAEMNARKAMGKGLRSADLLIMCAISAFNVKYDGRIDGSAVAQRDIDELRELELLAAEAIGLLGDAPGDVRLADALTLRGSIHRILDEPDLAKSDLRSALQVRPGASEAAYQLALLCLGQGDAAGALSATDASGDLARGPDPRLLTMRARALLVLGRTGELDAVLRSAIQTAKGTGDELSVRMNGADVAIEAGLLALAEELVAGVTETTELWLTHLWRARIAVKDGRASDADRHYRDACATATNEPDRRGANAEFAGYLARQGKVQEATVYFEEAGANLAEAPDNWHRMYARALYDTDSLATLSAFLLHLSESSPLATWALEFQARIAHRQGDTAAEAAILERIRANNPDALGATIFLVDAYLKLGRIGDATMLVGELARPDLLLTAVQRIQLAEVASRIGRHALALSSAFEATRMEPSDPTVQMAFVNFFLSSEQAELDLKATRVGPDTVVTIQNESQADDKITYVIVNRDDVDVRHECVVTDSRVADLISKVVGDVVVRRAGELSEARYRVTEIKSLYVHAFQDILANFAKRFPQSTALQAFRIGEVPTVADLAPVIRGATQLQKRSNLALELHEKQLLPLSTVAVLSGSDVRSVMYALSSGAARRLHIESGAPRQLTASLAAARAKGTVVLTHSALITAQDLDLLPLIEKLYSPLLVPASLIADIDKDVRKWSEGDTSGFTHLTMSGDRLALQETPAETVKRHVDRLRSLGNWVGTNCLSVARPLSSFGEGRDDIRERIGDSAFDAWHVAAERNAGLYVDDLGLKGLAETESAVRGFSTLTMLMAAAELQIIDGQQRDRGIVGLISRNYYFIPLRAELLLNVLAWNGFSVNGEVLRVFDRLADPDLVIELGIAVLSELVRFVALSVAGSFALHAVVIAGLEALTRNRSALDVVSAFGQDVRARLALLPLPLDEVARSVRHFLETKLRR